MLHLGPGVLTRWTDLKGQVTDALGVGHDILHVPVGLMIFVGLLFLFRRKERPVIWSFSVLLALQGANEVLDAIQWDIWTGTLPWAEAARDTMVTMAAPALILAIEIGWSSTRARSQD